MVACSIYILYVCLTGDFDGVTVTRDFFIDQHYELRFIILNTFLFTCIFLRKMIKNTKKIYIFCFIFNYYHLVQLTDRIFNDILKMVKCNYFSGSKEHLKVRFFLHPPLSPSRISLRVLYKLYNYRYILYINFCVIIQFPTKTYLAQFKKINSLVFGNNELISHYYELVICLIRVI